MIPANELRVGNIICSYTGAIREVTGEDIIKQWWFDSEPKDGSLCAPLNPVDLTAEWLERCGFRFENYSYNNGNFSLGQNFIRDASRNYDGFYLKIHLNDKKVSCVVRYLHQLQNLYFALNGEELKIEL